MISGNTKQSLVHYDKTISSCSYQADPVFVVLSKAQLDLIETILQLLLVVFKNQPFILFYTFNILDYQVSYMEEGI